MMTLKLDNVSKDESTSASVVSGKSINILSSMSTTCLRDNYDDYIFSRIFKTQLWREHQKSRGSERTEFSDAGNVILSKSRVSK